MPATTLHPNEILTGILLQLAVIVLAARLCGTVATWLRQPRVIGEMLAGLLLGPSVFGYFFPGASATIFPDVAAPTVALLSQLGLLLLMFQIGCDFEIGHLLLRVHRRAVAYVSVASVSIPLLVGFSMGRISASALAPDLAIVPYSLYVGVAFAVTAVPVLGRILGEYGLTKSVPGTVAMAAALGNDVVGWLLLAVISAYVSRGAGSHISLLYLVGSLILSAALWCTGRIVLRQLMQRFPIRGGMLPAGWMSLVLALICAAGVLAAHLGAFALFGGFVLGLMFRPYSQFIVAWRQSVGQFVLVFFLPIFFVSTGLHTDVGTLSATNEWLWCGAFFLAAIFSKVFPVYFAARLSGLTARPAALIAFMMNTRGLMELIVLNIGLSMRYISSTVYTMLVLMAIGTTILTGPILRRVMQKDEAGCSETLAAQS